MSLTLDSCIASIYEPGNPGSATDSGAITIPRYPVTYDVSVAEAAAAADSSNASLFAIYNVSVVETATAASAQDAAASALGRSAMLPGVFVNPSSSREAGVPGIMVNVS
jgi:hypothetical protein